MGMGLGIYTALVSEVVAEPLAESVWQGDKLAKVVWGASRERGYWKDVPFGHGVKSRWKVGVKF